MTRRRSVGKAGIDRGAEEHKPEVAVGLLLDAAARSSGEIAVALNIGVRVSFTFAPALPQ
jgi:hypothetical protein